jgi:hypothetical protein
MLNILSNTETAADPRAGSAWGAFMPGYVGTVEPNGTGAMVRPRPRPVANVGAFGYRDGNGNGNSTAAAFQSTAASPASPSQPSGPASELHNSCEKYAHTTRIAAASGGASGPHPARDPV